MMSRSEIIFRIMEMFVNKHFHGFLISYDKCTSSVVQYAGNEVPCNMLGTKFPAPLSSAHLCENRRQVER